MAIWRGGRWRRMDHRQCRAALRPRMKNSANADTVEKELEELADRVPDMRRQLLSSCSGALQSARVRPAQPACRSKDDL